MKIAFRRWMESHSEENTTISNGTKGKTATRLWINESRLAISNFKKATDKLIVLSLMLGKPKADPMKLEGAIILAKHELTLIRKLYREHHDLKKHTSKSIYIYNILEEILFSHGAVV